MMAELTSCPTGGHSSAGADRSLSLLVWIHSTPRQEGFQVRSTTTWSPVTIRHAQGFVTLITPAGSAGTPGSPRGRAPRGGDLWGTLSGAPGGGPGWRIRRSG